MKIATPRWSCSSASFAGGPEGDLGFAQVCQEYVAGAPEVCLGVDLVAEHGGEHGGEHAAAGSDEDGR